MSLPVASSTFTAGPKDDLASPDIYKLNPKQVINSIKPVASAVKDLFSSITMRSGQFDIVDSVKKLSNTDLGDAIGDSIKSLGANARDLGGDIVAKTTTFLEKTAPSAKALSCTVGEYTSKVDWKDVKESIELGRAVATMSGTNGIMKVVNKAANTGIFSGLIQKAGDAGVSGVFDTLKGKIQENGILMDVAKATTPFLLSRSNVRLLDELTSGGLGKSINMISPGFTKAFSSVYKGQRYNKISTFDGVMRSFDDISKDWDKATRDGGAGGSIVDILFGSKAFKDVIYSGIMYGTDYFSDTPEVRARNQRYESMANAQVYHKSTVSDQIAKYFPHTVMIGRYEERGIVADYVDFNLLNMR